MDEERILYGFWLSPYMSMVAHLLKEADLPFRYERLSPFVGDTSTAEHTERNPFGKIPTLQDSNGLLVSESQAICRYLARTHPEARRFYPCDDPVRCAEVDAVNDFITFSISGPFFNWFVVGGYFPNAFRMKTERESEIFSKWSMSVTRLALGRLTGGYRFAPFLLGSEPCLPDLQLFYVLELSKTFSGVFDIPFMDLPAGDEGLAAFYETMSARPAAKEILEAKAAEFPITRRELFEEFGKAYEEALKPGRAALSALFGHEV